MLGPIAVVLCITALLLLYRTSGMEDDLNRALALVAISILSVAVLAITLVLAVMSERGPDVTPQPPDQTQQEQPKPQPQPVPDTKPKFPEGEKITIAGMKNVFLIKQATGLVWLCRDDGHYELVSKGEQPEEQKINAVAAKLNPAQDRSQVVVLDQGLVGIPGDSVITYRGPDYVVTISSTGHTIAYGVDGEIKLRN